MTLKEQIKLALGIPESNFDHHNSDLLILFDGDIMNWLIANYEFSQNIKIDISNVECQKWYGKQFIEIPFGYEEYFLKKMK